MVSGSRKVRFRYIRKHARLFSLKHQYMFLRLHEKQLLTSLLTVKFYFSTGTQSESLCQILNQSEGQVQISEADLEAMEQVLDSSLSFAKQKSILRSYGQQFDNLLLYYLTKVKKNSKNIDSSSQKPQNCENSVAHFHVSSGASLHHIHCPFTDRSRFESGQSEGGMNSQQSLDHSNDVSSLSENYNFSLNHPLVSKRMWDYSLGYMVNYLYDLSSQTENAKQYKKNGTVPITLCTRK